MQEHQFESFIQPKCCANVRRSERQKAAQAISKAKADEVMTDPMLPYLNKINSFTI